MGKISNFDHDKSYFVTPAAQIACVKNKLSSLFFTLYSITLSQIISIFSPAAQRICFSSLWSPNGIFTVVSISE